MEDGGGDDGGVDDGVEEGGAAPPHPARFRSWAWRVAMESINRLDIDESGACGVEEALPHDLAGAAGCPSGARALRAAGESARCRDARGGVRTGRRA